MLVPLVLAAAINLVWLDREGYGNLYYAAAVKSMLISWHNFFFVAADPLGAVSVDKPPLGLWPQVAAARIGGYTGLSLLVPEALAGTLAVFLLYQLVAREAGTSAGFLAALLLALTPVSVATNRNNTMDSLLVPVLLGAAWTLLRALETDSFGWLLATGLLLGLAFNVKFLEGWLVLPGFAAAAWLGFRRSRRQRVARLAAASGVMLATALVWVLPVALTPPAHRPWIGSTQTNSIWELIGNYTALGRLIPQASHTQSLSLGGPDPLRLLRPDFGGQLSWLLPLALLGLLVCWWTHAVSRPELVLWGGWLLTGLLLFSGMGFLHPYYLVVLAPPVAALAAFGWCTLRRWSPRSGRWWLLPGGVAATLGLQLALLHPFPVWEHRLAPAMLLLTVIGLVLLVVRRGADRRGLGTIGAGLCLVGLLLVPAVWSALPVVQGGDPWLPHGGPMQDATGGGTPATLVGSERQLVAALRRDGGSERFLLATIGSPLASQIYLATGEPVMTLGGFSGNEPIPLPAQLLDQTRYLVLNPMQLTDPTDVFPPSLQHTVVARWLSRNGPWVLQHCAHQVVADTFSVYGPCRP